ncbi:hypothetical protein CJ030_MR5G023119 [Morella rubra]|uniref:Vacuole membrane protein KMS1 n=1 Tax=Morella rubra TaxID=262757 RepID=A0A6A1VQE7_9ROSI|nr:hypothetical protein CJ030_MR5G023119 [Morella rubra]
MVDKRLYYGFLITSGEAASTGITYLLAKGGWLLLLGTVVAAIGILIVTIDGPHGKDTGIQHVEELSRYIRFGLWWIALGVASSIGLGSGLHTFVLYLGPHIALFTLKAMLCGRHTATIQLEAVLWGLGTAIGELPPYFISRAASMSGNKLEAMEELDASSTEGRGVIATRLSQMKCWLLSHSQHLNFFTILALASVSSDFLLLSYCTGLLELIDTVPNPLFDLAGIMCGQFGIPFWKFFLATLIGKAIVKAHLQTVFIISVCNNQLLNWIENELIMMLSLVPGLSSVLTGLVAKINAVKDNFLNAPPPVASNIKVKKWDFSFGSLWNTVVWLMLMNFFVKIVTSTAQSYLRKQQENEVAAVLTNKSSTSEHSS